MRGGRAAFLFLRFTVRLPPSCHKQQGFQEARRTSADPPEGGPASEFPPCACWFSASLSPCPLPGALLLEPNLSPSPHAVPGPHREPASESWAETEDVLLGLVSCDGISWLWKTG